MIIRLMGPTASGKTQLAIQLAERLACEIISVDSAMVYRGMDIGTAKPSAAELAMIPHHLINICDPLDPFSAGRFCEEAHHLIREIQSRHKIPLLVGGTLLYFYWLQQGFADLPKANESIRQAISIRASQQGWPHLHHELQQIDPSTALHIHPNDGQRIQRALELYYSSGQTMAALQSAQRLQPLSMPMITLVIAHEDRARLHRRIEERFDGMLKKGLVEEVESLYRRGDLNDCLPSIRTVGYRQIWAYLAGEYSAEEMRERVLAATRQLAKRQYTWLRRWPEAQWIFSERSDLYPATLSFIEKTLH